MRSIAIAALLLAAPAAAQDDFWINRANDANQAAISSAMTTMNNGMVERAARRGGTSVSRARMPAESEARARATCANYAMAVRKNGANHPGVRKFKQLCDLAGYPTG